ncbi:MAG: HGGxSTG domain-containing protein [Anaerolineaceae bacterium]
MRASTAEPLPDRCGARLRGPRAGRYCAMPPVSGRARCRMHGGFAGAPAGPRNGKWKDGSRAQIVAPLDAEEVALRERLRAEDFRDLRPVIGDVKFLFARAVGAGNHDAAARHAAALGGLVRAQMAVWQTPIVDVLVDEQTVHQIMAILEDILVSEVADPDVLARVSDRFGAIDWSTVPSVQPGSAHLPRAADLELPALTPPSELTVGMRRAWASGEAV